MGKEVAVQGCTFKIKSPMGITNANFVVQSQPSTKVLADNKGVYFDKIQVQLVSGAVFQGGTLKAPVSINIDASGSNMLEDGDKTVLKGDTNLIPVTATFVIDSTPPVSIPAPITVEVDDPGQTYVMLS